MNFCTCVKHLNQRMSVMLCNCTTENKKNETGLTSNASPLTLNFGEPVLQSFHYLDVGRSHLPPGRRFP